MSRSPKTKRTALQQLEVDCALQEVGEMARELVEGAEGIPMRRGTPYDGGFVVQAVHLAELREALKRWSAATENFLKMMSDGDEP